VGPGAGSVCQQDNLASVAGQINKNAKADACSDCDLDGGSGKYPNLDGDGCGDALGGSFFTRTYDVNRVACVDRDDNGEVDLPICVSWANNPKEFDCSTAADVVPGTRSKCICGPGNLKGATKVRINTQPVGTTAAASSSSSSGTTVAPGQPSRQVTVTVVIPKTSKQTPERVAEFGNKRGGKCVVMPSQQGGKKVECTIDVPASAPETPPSVDMTTLTAIVADFQDGVSADIRTTDALVTSAPPPASGLGKEGTIGIIVGLVALCLAIAIVACIAAVVIVRKKDQGNQALRYSRASHIEKHHHGDI
jgi:hypothetical protein